MAPSPEHLAILWPLAVAVALTFCTVIIHGLVLMPITYFVRYELRLGRAGVLFWRDVGIVAAATVVALAAHLIAIATWALVFTLCGEFSELAPALYHSGMNYTTLGDSDKVMSQSWRLLASFEAANGMLMFGVSTAMLFAVIQRLFQTRLKD
jgi:Ion channel